MTDIRDLLSNADAVLLDFDGPLCSVFAGYPAPVIARELLSFLAEQRVVLPAQVVQVRDPLEVLRWTGEHRSAFTLAVEDMLCAAEARAVETAAPAEFARSAVEAARSRGQSVAIVSNNSAQAIKKYLALHDLDRHINLVIGRPYAEPARMKPSPENVVRAVEKLAVERDASVFVGDTVSDIEASLRAGAHPIGYAKNADRAQALADAGAEFVIESMQTLC